MGGQKSTVSLLKNSGLVFLGFMQNPIKTTHEQRTKIPGCLGYIGDYILPSYVGIMIIIHTPLQGSLH